MKEVLLDCRYWSRVARSDRATNLAKSWCTMAERVRMKEVLLDCRYWSRVAVHSSGPPLAASTSASAIRPARRQHATAASRLPPNMARLRVVASSVGGTAGGSGLAAAAASCSSVATASCEKSAAGSSSAAEADAVGVVGATGDVIS